MTEHEEHEIPIPDELWQVVERMAEERGETTDEVMVRLMRGILDDED